MSHVSPAQQRGNTKTHKWQLKQSPLETHSALPCTHSEMWGDLIKNRTQYMAVLVQNGMVITLFAHPVAHSNRQPNLALNPCPQRWVLSFMSHVFLAQRQRQHNPTIDCNATCIQTSSRREHGEPLCSQSGSRRERDGHHPMRKIQQSAAETATPAKTLHTPFLNPGSPRTQDTLLLGSPGKPS